MVLGMVLGSNLETNGSKNEPKKVSAEEIQKPTQKYGNSAKLFGIFRNFRRIRTNLRRIRTYGVPGKFFGESAPTEFFGKFFGESEEIFGIFRSSKNSLREEVGKIRNSIKRPPKITKFEP